MFGLARQDLYQVEYKIKCKSRQRLCNKFYLYCLPLYFVNSSMWQETDGQAQFDKNAITQEMQPSEVQELNRQFSDDAVAAAFAVSVLEPRSLQVRKRWILAFNVSTDMIIKQQADAVVKEQTCHYRLKVPATEQETGK